MPQRQTAEPRSIPCPPGHSTSPFLRSCFRAGWPQPQPQDGFTSPQMHWLFLNFTRFLSHLVSSLRVAALLGRETITLDLVSLKLAELFSPVNQAVNKDFLQHWPYYCKMLLLPTSCRLCIRKSCQFPTYLAVLNPNHT